MLFVMKWFVCFLFCFSCYAETPLQRLEQNILESQEISLKADADEVERLLLKSYDQLELERIPLLVTTTVWEDGFGDYIHLQYVLATLLELGLNDIEVIVFYADCHREKLKSHPLPDGLTVHFVEFSRGETECTVKDGHTTSTFSKKELASFAGKSPYFDSYRQGKRELIVVATFFGEAFEQLKGMQGRHPLYLREMTPYLSKALLQDLFVFGWGRNRSYGRRCKADED